MKKLIYLLLVFAAFAGCKKDNDNGKLDPKATINLRPAKGVQLRADNPQHLTALEIVKQTTNLKWINEELTGGITTIIGRGFSDAQRDFNAPMLKMWGTDIIDQEGKYATGFINGRDMVLQRVINDGKPNVFVDTIAYIPNSVVIEARKTVKAAYDAGNYTECYRLFNEAFTFIPITGMEWQALKAQGKN